MSDQSMFQAVQAAKPDAILGLTEAFNADERPDKINLAVGVYKDENGQTPVLNSVKAAEKQLYDAESTKSYLPINGPADFGLLTQQLLFGPDHPAIGEQRCATAQTPGGTGALRVAADYLAHNHGKPTIYLSDPTWANHNAIFSAAGLTTATYPYFDASKNALDFNAMIAGLERAKAGDVVLLHACCHNPTGVDLNPDQWIEVARVLRDRELLPLIDFAYQGFAHGLTEDAGGIAALASRLDDMLICSSYSKNFGLYNERIGALTVMTGSADTTANVLSQIKSTIRSNYSNPPAHGGKIVSTILNSTDLKKQWIDEVTVMRNRINDIRLKFKAALDERVIQLAPDGNDFITQQNGMFSFSGLKKEQVEALRFQHGIYIVGSGRINVAGINESKIDRLCDAIKACMA